MVRRGNIKILQDLRRIQETPVLNQHPLTFLHKTSLIITELQNVTNRLLQNVANQLQLQQEEVLLSVPLFKHEKHEFSAAWKHEEEGHQISQTLPTAGKTTAQVPVSCFQSRKWTNMNKTFQL